jgi:hypothetical protein
VAPTNQSNPERQQSSQGLGSSSQTREQNRLWAETWFRGIALMLVVIAVVFYPLYALVFEISPATLNQVIAPVTGIAGAVIGYWFGQASRRIQDSPNSSEGGGHPAP